MEDYYDYDYDDGGDEFMGAIQDQFGDISPDELLEYIKIQGGSISPEMQLALDAHRQR